MIFKRLAVKFPLAPPNKSLLAGGAIFLAGIIAWGAFNWSLELANTERFCISCHEMYEFVYQDYTGTSHFANRAGVRASCPDCHVPREWVHKVVRKISATNELFHWLRGSIETPEKFEARREVLAERVWSSMVATDSRECRNCHDIAAMSRERQGMTAGATHDLGERWQMTCIDCHKGVVHSLPASFDKKAEMDSLHDQIETAEVPCGLCHEGMAGAGDEDDWD